jgi:hypothetical protein
MSDPISVLRIFFKPPVRPFFSPVFFLAIISKFQSPKEDLA